MGRVQRHHLSDAKLAVPPDPLLREMSERLRTYSRTPWARDVQSRTLAAVRDVLLPKLISGQLRVVDARRFIEVTA